MKNALLVGVILSLTVLSLSTCEKGPEVDSTWAGSYEGFNGSGSIPGWKLMSDGTTTGMWADASGTVSLKIDADYAPSSGSLAITASGTATSTSLTPATGAYTLTCTGTLGSTTGSGAYAITFSASSWSVAADVGT